MKKRPAKLLGIVILSLGVHLLFLFALMQSHSLKVSKRDKRLPDQLIPIQARLVFTPVISAPESPVKTEELREGASQEITVPEISEINEQVVNEASPLQVAKQEVDVIPPVKASPPKQALQKNYSVIDYTNAPDLARRQLRGLNQIKLQTMVQQAAREYQQQKNAPNLELKPADPFLTEDEKLRKSVQVNVNCDGYTNTATSMLSGLFGGTLKCTDAPKIDSFIQNRLNKAELIGAPTKP